MQATNGDTGVTPSHVNEPLLNNKSPVSVNAEHSDEEADPDAFLTNALGSKGAADAIAKQ